MNRDPKTVPADPRDPNAKAGADPAQKGEPTHPSQPETKERPLFPVLDDFWEALQRDGKSDLEEWLTTHAHGREGLAELHVLAALHETRQLLLEDSQVEGEDGGGEDGRQLLEPGTRLGECRIEGLLGCGGMGEVYLAEHEVLGRKVAVKVLPAHLATNPEAVQRFRRSLQILARLDPHHHVAVALHASEHQGRLYLVMEYVPGMDLRAYVRQYGRLPVAKACALIRQAAVGLQYAHDHGIVHRDIKPSNLMLTPEGTVKILDLGLARLTIPESPELASGQTHAGVILGTVDFIAPEQSRNAKQADARSDLYSLGCTFYYLLTGQPPFADRSPLETLMAHALAAPEELAQVRPDVPPGVVDLVHQLMAKRPEERFPSARAFLEALDTATGLTPSLPGIAATSGGNARTGAHRRVAVALATTFLLLALALGAWLVLSPLEAPPLLKDLELTVRRNGNEKNKVTEHLVRNGEDRTEQKLRALEPLALKNVALHVDGDDFGLRGRLNRPVYWYVLWFDTAGNVTVEEHSEGRQTTLEYPAKDKDTGEPQLVKADPTNPIGLHVVALVAGSIGPEKGKELLERKLQDVGKPPPPMEHSWANVIHPRGGGERTATRSVLSRDEYLERIRTRLPAGLYLLHWFSLKTAQPE